MIPLHPKNLFPIKITPVDGKEIDVSNLFREVHIHENLFENFVTGYMDLIDTPETRLVLQGLSGIGDEISFSFSGTDSSGNPEPSINIKMLIYRIEASGQSGAASQLLTIHFSTNSFLKHEVVSIQEQFNGKISDIIKKLAARTGINKIEIEESDQSLIRVFNFSNPIKIINDLTRMCGKGNDFNFIFYSTIDGLYRLISIATLMKAPSKWGSNSKNGFVVSLAYRNLSSEEKKRMVLAHNVSSLSPVLNSHNGMVASSVLTVDVIDKTYTETYFSIKDDFKKQTHLSDKPLANLDSEYIKSIVDSPTISTTRYKSRYLFNCEEEKEGQDQIGGNKDWLLKRTSQIEQLNQLSIVFKIPGNSVIRAGDVFFFGRPINEYLANKSKNGKKEKDIQYSGKYLCTSVKHSIQFNKNIPEYVTIIKGIKDSKGSE